MFVLLIDGSDYSFQMVDLGTNYIERGLCYHVCGGKLILVIRMVDDYWFRKDNQLLKRIKS